MEVLAESSLGGSFLQHYLPWGIWPGVVSSEVSLHPGQTAVINGHDG